tara:strand:+ start:463 stop:702 length:240 start_codon:yes stop_codon:yes gene_type:complete
MRWPKWLRGIGRTKVGWFSPPREVYVRENNTPLGKYYGAVLYENGYHIHTIGMDKYDQKFIDNLRETWVTKGTYTRYNI